MNFKLTDHRYQENIDNSIKIQLALINEMNEDLLSIRNNPNKDLENIFDYLIYLDRLDFLNSQKLWLINRKKSEFISNKYLKDLNIHIYVETLDEKDYDSICNIVSLDNSSYNKLMEINPNYNKHIKMGCFR